jgi:hypothetical protein
MAATQLSEIPPLSEETKARWHALIEEYQELINAEFDNTITPAQQERLEEVKRELDDIEACMPETIQMFQRLDETERKLNALLEYVESLPDK